MDNISRVSSWLLVKRYDQNFNKVIDKEGPEKKDYDRLVKAGATDQNEPGLDEQELAEFYSGKTADRQQCADQEEFEKYLLYAKAPFYQQINNIAQYVQTHHVDGLVPDPQIADQFDALEELRRFSIHIPSKIFTRYYYYFELLKNVIKSDADHNTKQMAMLALNGMQHPCTRDFLREIVKAAGDGRYMDLWDSAELPTLFVDYKVYEAIDVYRQMLISISDITDNRYQFLFSSGLFMLKDLGGAESIKALEQILDKTVDPGRKKMVQEALQEAKNKE